MIGLILGIPLGIMYLLIKIYQVITNKYITRNKMVIIWGAVGIALLVSQIVPPKEWDLYRHYDEINRIREWGASYAWEKSRYANYYGATALFYLTSLTPWNGTLPFITILLEILIFEKVIAHYKNQVGAQSAGICFFLFLALSNIVMAISGIRNVLAVTLINYAIWDFENVKKGHLFIDIILVILAVNIHPAGGFLIVIYAMAYIHSHIVGVAIAVCILPFLSQVLEKFSASKNAILSSSSGLFALYIEKQAGLDIRVRIVSVILIGASILIILQVYRYEKKMDRYLYFIFLYSIGTLGMIAQGLVYSRMLYGLNILYPILIVHYCSNDGNIRMMKSTYWYKVCCLIYCIGMLLFQGYELAIAIFLK